MRIHTDKLTKEDLFRESPNGCFLEVTTHGSRKRDHAFNVGMGAMIGNDAHGIKRAFSRNTGKYGGNGFNEYDRAATYIEWGDWMVKLFKLDPEAIIGPYSSPAEFVRITHEYAPHRPDRENAEEHADRWSKELWYSGVTSEAVHA